MQKPEDITLRQLQDEVGAWSRKNFGDQPASNPLHGMVEETGELAETLLGIMASLGKINHAYLKMQQGIRVNEDHKANAEDALADFLVFAADFCARSGLNLQEALNKTWAKVCQRDWTKNKKDGVTE